MSKKKEIAVSEREEALLAVLTEFVEDIEAAGGCMKNDDDVVTLVSDEDWTDLAETYVKACAVLGREAAIEKDEDEEEEDEGNEDEDEDDGEGEDEEPAPA